MDSLDKGRSRRDLIERVMSDVKVICKSLTDDVRDRLVGFLTMALQKPRHAGR